MSQLNLDNKKILVTGASGFIGSHLVEKLLTISSSVKCFVHYNSRMDVGNISHLTDKVEIFKGDISDPVAVSNAVKDVDVVFHLSSLIGIPYSYQATNSYVDTNIKGMLNILNSCRDYDTCKLITTSTSEVYGSALYTPIDENHPLQAQSPYSATKVAADKLAESYYLSFDTPVVIVRPFNTYGPRQSTRAVIPTIINQLLDYNYLQLGCLNTIRDMVYVEDTVNGFIMAATNIKPSDGVVNIGTGVGYTICDIAHKIARLMNKSIDNFSTDYKRLRPDKSEVKELVCDKSKMLKLSGWQPEHSLHDDYGLTKTIEYYKNNKLGNGYNV